MHSISLDSYTLRGYKQPHTQYLLDFLDKLAGVTVPGSKQLGLDSKLK